MEIKADLQSPFVFVVGYSGAGLRTAINTMQDAGFLCIDNLPASMLAPTLDTLHGKPMTPERGVVVRPRLVTEVHVGEFLGVLQGLRRRGIPFDMLFLKADNHVLYERYSTTRRRHPFVKDGVKNGAKNGLDIFQAIEAEICLLKDVYLLATITLDTTHFFPKDLIKAIEQAFQSQMAVRILNVSLFSFGFKHGGLTHVDEMYDVRFLDNPFFIHGLRTKTGLDGEVSAFMEQDSKACEFLDKLHGLHHWLLPLYYAEGRHYLRVGVGCTGGKHRSVWLVEALTKKLKALALPHISYTAYHRDLSQPGI